MPISEASIELGRCYATSRGEVLKIIEVNPAILTYVARGKLAFPTWDRKQWRSTTPEVFAQRVEHEVPCDWNAG